MQAFNQLMLLKEGFGCSFKRNAAVVQGNHVVSGNHFVHEMRNMDDSLSSCTEFLDKSHNVISMNNVKSCGRFVKNEDLRLHDQRARDGYALLLAAREHLRIFGRKLGESPKGNLLFYQRCYLIARYLEVL